MHNYRFRAATRADQAAIQLLIQQVLDEYGLGLDLPGTDQDLQDIENMYFARGGYFGVVLNAREQIVGSYGFCPHNSQTAELRKMYLLPEARGQGLGKTLLQALLHQIQQAGFQRVILETNSRLKAAVKLYQQFGFQPFEPALGPCAARCDQAFELILQREESIHAN